MRVKIWDEHSIRVNRGGSWTSNALFCRVAFRFNYDPSNRYYNLGFRLVRRSK